MIKKDFIKKIRECNKAFRGHHKDKCPGIFINGIFFFYGSVKFIFDDDLGELFIYDGGKNRIIANVFYSGVKIDFICWA